MSPAVDRQHLDCDLAAAGARVVLEPGPPTPRACSPAAARPGAGPRRRRARAAAGPARAGGAPGRARGARGLAPGAGWWRCSRSQPARSTRLRPCPPPPPRAPRVPRPAAPARPAAVRRGRSGRSGGAVGAVGAPAPPAAARSAASGPPGRRRAPPAAAPPPPPGRRRRAGPGPVPRRRAGPRRGHRREPLVDEPDGHRRDPGGERGGVVAGHRQRAALRPGQVPRQPDDDLDGLVLDDHRGERIEVAARRASRARVASGVASTPSRSLTATPTRTVPTSTASRTPTGRAPRVTGASGPAVTRVATRWSTSRAPPRARRPVGRRPARRRRVPPPPPPSIGASSRTSVARGEPAARAGRWSPRRRPAPCRRPGTDRRRRRPAGGEPPADVERELAHVVGAGAGRAPRRVTTATPPTSRSPAREVARPREDRGGAQPVELLLRPRAAGRRAPRPGRAAPRRVP